MTVSTFRSNNMQKAQTETLEHVEFYDDSRAIPLNSVQRAYDYFSYGAPARVMFGMLALTGCRIAELDRMRASMIYGDVLHWHLGKRQRTTRRVRLPQWFLAEIRYMRAEEACRGDQLFPIIAETFRKYFYNCRESIGGEWLDKVVRYREQKPFLEFRLQLNGLRKNYQTVNFSGNIAKHGNEYAALLFTAKDMRHKSEKITVTHYLENFDRVGIKRGETRPLLLPEEQTSLGDWL